MAAFPKIYSSFAEFERDELRKLDSLHTTIEDMLDERFAEELNFEDAGQSKRSGKRRRAS
jgi:hypothetical protein